MNGIRPMLTGLHYDTPRVDGDYMGRAYPCLYLATPYRNSPHILNLPILTCAVFGKCVTPCVQADGAGNIVSVYKADSFHRAEKIHRKAGLELGLFSQLTIAPLTVKETKEVANLGTTSLAWRIGRAVHLARHKKTSIMKAIVSVLYCLKVSA